jgi:hypothetical protein
MDLFDLPRRVLSCYPVADVAATFATLHMPASGQPKLDEVNSQLGALRLLHTIVQNFFSNPPGVPIYHGAGP